MGWAMTPLTLQRRKVKLKLKEGECLPQGSAISKWSWDGNPA